MTGRAALSIDAVRPMRHAIEIRNETFLDPGFITLLRRHNVALVVADTGERWPQPHDITSDFLYLRLHGATELYRSRYSEAELRCWADRLRAWSAGDQQNDGKLVMPNAEIPRVPRDVFCYFDNTDKLHAPANARRLMQMLDVKWVAGATAVNAIAAVGRRGAFGGGIAKFGGGALAAESRRSAVARSGEESRHSVAARRHTVRVRGRRSPDASSARSSPASAPCALAIHALVVRVVEPLLCRVRGVLRITGTDCAAAETDPCQRRLRRLHHRQ